MEILQHLGQKNSRRAVIFGGWPPWHFETERFEIEPRIRGNLPKETASKIHRANSPETDTPPLRRKFPINYTRKSRFGWAESTEEAQPRTPASGLWLLPSALARYIKEDN